MLLCCIVAVYPQIFASIICLICYDLGIDIFVYEILIKLLTKSVGWSRSLCKVVCGGRAYYQRQILLCCIVAIYP
ncbi:hypothetical protein Hanom_Chr13g01184071 [Helianthus anomalus]